MIALTHGIGIALAALPLLLVSLTSLSTLAPPSIKLESRRPEEKRE